MDDRASTGLIVLAAIFGTFLLVGLFKGGRAGLFRLSYMVVSLGVLAVFGLIVIRLL